MSEFINEFTEALEQCTSENENIRSNATNFVLQFRSNSFINFLNTILLVLKNPERSLLSKSVALISTYQSLERFVSPDPLQKNYQFLENSAPGLLNEFLYASLALFNHIPVLSAHVFSCITIIICDFADDSDIIQNLCQSINLDADVNFIEGALIAIEDVCKELYLSHQQYFPVLEKIYQLYNTKTIPNNTKVHIMNIIKYLICIIKSVFNKTDSKNSIFQIIFSSLESDITSPAAYECLNQIAKYQFLSFLEISDKLIPITLLILETNSQNENLIIQVCLMLNQLAKNSESDENENENEDEKAFKSLRNENLTKYFFSFFPFLLNTCLNHGQTQLDSPEVFNGYTVCMEVISNFAKAIPDVTFSPLLEFANQNVSSEKIENREMSILFLSLIVTFCDLSNLSLPHILQLIPLKLNDDSPRVRNSALYLILSLIYRNDIYQNCKQTIFQFVPQIIQLLNDDPQIASSVCLIIDQIHDFPDLSHILSILLSFVSVNNNIFSISLFNSITEIIKYLDFPTFQTVLPTLVDLVVQSIVNTSLIHNQEEIFFMFKTVCKIGECLLDPYSQNLYNLFVQDYKQTKNNKVLYLICHLASATSNTFAPLLSDFIGLLVSAMPFSELDNSLKTDIISSFLYLNNFFDLNPFIRLISSTFINEVSNNSTNIEILSEILGAFSVFFKKFYQLISDAVNPMIFAISSLVSKISDFNDFYTQNHFVMKTTDFLLSTFEKADRSNSTKLFDITFCFLIEVIKIYIDEVDIEDSISENLFEKLIYLFRQLLNVDNEVVTLFILNNDIVLLFMKHLLKNNQFQATTFNFLCDLKIDIGIFG